jgi:ribosomal protein S18 acetylase RimI-like enzyme
MLSYRPATPSDALVIALLHTRSWRENYRGAYTDTALDNEQPAERIQAWNSKLDDPSEHQFVQLAFEADQLVGFVCAIGDEHPEWGSLIDNLHVVAEAKGRGIGAALMQQAATWLDQRYPQLPVHLFVLAVNAKAIPFYEHLGASNDWPVSLERRDGTVLPGYRCIWPNPAAIVAEKLR